MKKKDEITEKEIEKYLEILDGIDDNIQMGDTHEYIQGGLTYDKEKSFMKFINKINQEEKN